MQAPGWILRSGRTARRAVLLAAVVGLVSSATANAATQGEEPRFPLKAYMVWVSTKDSKEFPKELEPFKDRLRKAFRGRAFRLHGTPFSGELAPGKTLSLELPQGYSTRWRIPDDASREPAVRQTLVNPKKLETVALLKKSPAMVHLERIRQGDESFLLIVTFGKATKPEEKS